MLMCACAGLRVRNIYIKFEQLPNTCGATPSRALNRGCGSARQKSGLAKAGLAGAATPPVTIYFESLKCIL